MAEYLLVTFNFEGKPAPREALAKLFNKALDWVTYAPNCWILYTTTDKEIWFDRLKKIVNADASIFIIEFDRNNRTGYMPTRIWEWLNKER